MHVAEPDGSVKLVSEPGTYHLKFGEQLVFKPRMMHIVSPFFNPILWPAFPYHLCIPVFCSSYERRTKDNTRQSRILMTLLRKKLEAVKLRRAKDRCASPSTLEKNLRPLIMSVSSILCLPLSLKPPRHLQIRAEPSVVQENSTEYLARAATFRIRVNKL
jgi:hypothetical protein